MNEFHDRIVKAAKCTASEVLTNTWQETEYHIDVHQATNGAHIKI
jgi:hypothetical protein